MSLLDEPMVVSRPKAYLPFIGFSGVGWWLAFGAPGFPDISFGHLEGWAYWIAFIITMILVIPLALIGFAGFMVLSTWIDPTLAVIGKDIEATSARTPWPNAIRKILYGILFLTALPWILALIGSHD